MQYFSCQVAIAGDVRNKIFMSRVSVPEIQLLRLIHGENEVTDLRGVEKVPLNDQRDEVDRLQMKYSKYANIVANLSRDFQGRFPSDIRDLRIQSSCFAADPFAQFEVAEMLEGERIGDDDEVDPDDIDLDDVDIDEDDSD